VINAGEESGPHDGHQKAVRPRVIREVQGGKAGVAGVNTDLLPSEEQEWRPQQVEKERSGDENAKGGSGSELFGGKADGEMAMNMALGRCNSNLTLRQQDATVAESEGGTHPPIFS